MRHPYRKRTHVEHEGVTFCLITDVGHITEEIQEFIGKANYLVLESNYSVEMLQAEKSSMAA